MKSPSILADSLEKENQPQSFKNSSASEALQATLLEGEKIVANFSFSEGGKILRDLELKKHSHPFYQKVYWYAAKWAETMEHAIEKEGKNLPQAAEAFLSASQQNELSRGMLYAAVKILSNCWKYGSWLWLWYHTKKK